MNEQGKVPRDFRSDEALERNRKDNQDAGMGMGVPDIPLRIGGTALSSPIDAPLELPREPKL
mgnify:CR=1 FL=1